MNGNCHYQECDGRMDGRTSPYHNTSRFQRAYKKFVSSPVTIRPKDPDQLGWLVNIPKYLTPSQNTDLSDMWMILKGLLKLVSQILLITSEEKTNLIVSVLFFFPLFFFFII
jgi:hypothetical protein